MSFFELQTDYFRPLWRRVVVVAICLGWAAFEFLTGAPFWGVIFGSLGVYAYWQFFVSPWPSTASNEKEPPTETDESG